MGLREIGCEDVHWKIGANNRLMMMVLNFQISYRQESSSPVNKHQLLKEHFVSLCS